MRLRRELLGAELVGGDELARHVAGLEVTERVEDDLADHGVVRYHHRDGSEERLEVIGELGATRVAQVHGDKHVARATQAAISVPSKSKSSSFAALARVIVRIC